MTMYSELHCHSIQLMLCQKVKKGKKKRRLPNLQMGGLFWPRPDSLQILGASSKWNTTGALQKDCEEPHHGIDALLPVEAQSNVSSFIPSSRFQCRLISIDLWSVKAALPHM